MGSEGFVSRNAKDYVNETEFHLELEKTIIEAIERTIGKVLNPSFIEKFKSWRTIKKMEVPAIKKITKTKRTLNIQSAIASVDLKGGEKIEYTVKKKFSIHDLGKYITEKLKLHNLDEIKIIFEEVSILSKIVENEMDSTLQEWFFDFIDTGRVINAKGLTFTIDLLPNKSTFGSHFSDSHARLIYLDYDLASDFSDLGTQMLNKRISYYTDQKNFDYRQLFTKTAKDLLDRASSGVPRIFLYIAQLCFKAKILNGSDRINRDIVSQVLRYYAQLKERKLATNQSHLFQDLLKTISNSKQNRFIFKSDDLGNLPSAFRKFVYDMYKQEMFIKKRSFLTLNQALWLGTGAVKGLNKNTKNSTISIMDYQDNGFKVVSIKEIIEKKTLSFEDFLDSDKTTKEISTEYDVKKEEEEELVVEEELPVDADEKMLDIITTDDLEISTDINFPITHVKSIMQRYWPSPKQIPKESIIFCQDRLKEKTLDIIYEIDQILLRRGETKFTSEIIIEIKDNDETLLKGSMGVLAEIEILEPKLKANTLGRLINDVMPYIKTNRESLISFLQYLEYWIGYYLHYCALMSDHKKKKRMTKNDIEEVFFKNNTN